MPSLTAKKEDLKKVFGITSLASSDYSDKISGHALVKVCPQDVMAYTTDGDRMAFAKFIPIEADTFEFTLDPKKMLAVISSTDIDLIRIKYDAEAKTVQIYASDNPNAVLSFPSFDPDTFLSFDSEIGKVTPMGDIDTATLQIGIKFIQGFLPEEKTPKMDKYTRLYASKGILYGANGSNKIGAFQSPELASMDELAIRRAMLPPIIHFIDRSSSVKATLATTSGKVFIMSPDKFCGFGFLRTNDAIPKYPISVDDPQYEGFSVSRQMLLKKMGRLAITSNKDLGIKARIEAQSMSLSTVSERVSMDTLECSPKGTETLPVLEFTFDYKLLKSVLNLFQATDLDMYVEKFKCTIISQAQIEVIETKERKPFKAVALMSLARAI